MYSLDKYFEIANHRVLMFWQCPYCENANAWYGPDNGTPGCECGADLEYVRTEICLTGLDT